MNRLDRLLDLDSDPIRNRPQPRRVHPGVYAAVNHLKSVPGRFVVALAAGGMVTAALAMTSPDQTAPTTPPLPASASANSTPPVTP